MRLIKYINEKFMGGDLVDGKIIPIFKNPDYTEMKELRELNSYGLKVILDFQHKDFYVTADTLTFEDMIDKIKPNIQGLDYKKYYQKGMGMERFLFLHSIGLEFNSVTTDITGHMLSTSRYDNYDDIVSKHEEMLDKAKSGSSWFGKWLNTSQVNKVITDNLKYFTKIRDGIKK